MGSERRGSPRLYPISRIDIAISGKNETYRGSLANVSRKGVALHIRQHLRLYSHVTIRFRFLEEDGRREVNEMLPAKVVWQSGDYAGLEFAAPIKLGR